MVFALDHLDGTCSYTECRNRAPAYFEYTGPHHDSRHDYYTQKVERRERECRSLIDEIAQANFASAALGFDKKVKIDAQKVIMAGHSMGGCTALYVGESDPRVKAVVTLDPWLLPMKTEIEGLKLKKLAQKPTFLLNSSHFHRSIYYYDHETLFNKLANEIMKPKNLENIIINKSNHSHQTDIVCMTPLEVELGGDAKYTDTRYPRTHLPQLHQLMILLQLDFLSRAGFGNEIDSTQRVNAQIDKWKEEYVNYLKKY